MGNNMGKAHGLISSSSRAIGVSSKLGKIKHLMGNTSNIPKANTSKVANSSSRADIHSNINSNTSTRRSHNRNQTAKTNDGLTDVFMRI